MAVKWCRWPDSNRHGLRHCPLKTACLPNSTTSAICCFLRIIANGRRFTQGVSAVGSGTGATGTSSVRWPACLRRPGMTMGTSASSGMAAGTSASLGMAAGTSLDSASSLSTSIMPPGPTVASPGVGAVIPSGITRIKLSSLGTFLTTQASARQFIKTMRPPCQ